MLEQDQAFVMVSPNPADKGSSELAVVKCTIVDEEKK
jgi:hypothetical protein